MSSPPRAVPFSALVVTLDEERYLDACLASLAFCDEIIVIDLGSTDRSVNRARPGGARMSEMLHRVTGRASVGVERALAPLIMRHRTGAKDPGAPLDRTGVWVREGERLPVLFRDAEVLWADYPHPAHALWRAQEFSLFAQSRGLIERPVLDFGCGDGAFASVLFDAIDVGVDIDPGALAAAQRSGIYRRLELATDTRIPLEDASVRSVISNSVLEHVIDLESVLGEIKRVLAPGGRLFFSVPVAAFREHLARYFGRAESDRVNREAFHRNLLEPAEWRRLLERQGFTVEQVRSFQPARFTYWFRMLRFCGRRGLGGIIPGFRARFWARFGRRLVEMVRGSIRSTPDGAGGNIFVIARA